MCATDTDSPEAPHSRADTACGDRFDVDIPAIVRQSLKCAIGTVKVTSVATYDAIAIDNVKALTTWRRGMLS